MNSEPLTFNATYGKYEIEDVEILFEDNITEYDLKDKLLDALIDEHPELADKSLEIEDTDYDVSNYGSFGSYSNLSDIDIIFELYECNTESNFGAIDAAIELGIEIRAIDDSFYGEYGNHEEFIDEYIKDHGVDIPDFLSIDYSDTFDNMSYQEYNGYYFSTY